jgi:hypothetical protein
MLHRIEPHEPHEPIRAQELLAIRRDSSLASPQATPVSDAADQPPQHYSCDPADGQLEFENTSFALPVDRLRQATKDHQQLSA